MNAISMQASYYPRALADAFNLKDEVDFSEPRDEKRYWTSDNNPYWGKTHRYYQYIEGSPKEDRDPAARAAVRPVRSEPRL